MEETNTNTLLMQHALDDVEKYGKDLITAATAMDTLSNMLLDVPDADEAQRAAETFAKAYQIIGEDLVRLASRGLGR